MWRYAKDLSGYSVCGTDGSIGSIADIYFDDDTWTVRYLVVATGERLPVKEVLVSPIAFDQVNDGYKLILIKLKRGQVDNSPRVTPGKPVSRKYEKEYYRYYGWPVYWGEGGRWGSDLYPSHLFTAAPLNESPVSPEDMLRETSLRSTRDVGNFTVYASDGEIGRVEDFVINDETWEIRYVVVDASTFEPGRKVIVSPHWIAMMGDAEKMMVADMGRQEIKESPSFDKAKGVDRNYELTLFKHYRRDLDLEAIRVNRKAFI